MVFKFISDHEVVCCQRRMDWNHTVNLQLCFAKFTIFLQRIEWTIAKQPKSPMQDKKVKQAQGNLNPRLFLFVMWSSPPRSTNQSTTTSSIKSGLKSILGNVLPMVNAINDCIFAKSIVTIINPLFPPTKKVSQFSTWSCIGWHTFPQNIKLSSQDLHEHFLTVCIHWQIYCFK